MKPILSSITAPGPTGTRPGFGQTKISEDDFVAPGFTKEILKYLELQLLVGAAPIAPSRK